jgi:hypothetical protein
MTDNVIKDIEYCLEQGITSECERCVDKIGCRDTLLRNALDLINRQKAEIERLKDIARSALKESINICDAIFEAKSEARKEFAERLKKVMVATHKDTNGYCQYRTEDCEIDNLLAELERTTEKGGETDA